MTAERKDDSVRMTQQALRAVGRSWSEKRFASNLPSFDWESVARVMAAVRAI